jgi:hypothetical protein
MKIRQEWLFQPIQPPSNKIWLNMLYRL